MGYSLTLSQFNEFSDEEKENYVQRIHTLFIDQLWTRDEVKNELNICTNLIKHLLKEYDIKKTPEQLKTTTERTCILKYGVKSTNQLDSVKKKQSETCMFGINYKLKEVY